MKINTLLNKIKRKIGFHPSNKAQNVNFSKDVIIHIGEKKYTVSTDDNYLSTSDDEFEPLMVKLFQTLANKSEVIFDIGANIGCTALLFSQLSKSVHAFEPSKTTYNFLEKNIKQSGASNIFSHNIGLGSESGEFTLTFDPLNRAGGFVSNQVQASVGHAEEKIVIKSLDEVVKLISPHKIDFIKIDVEGFEGQVLRGATNTLSTYKPLIVMELNHWCLNAFQRTSIPDFFDFLRSKFPILLAVDGTNYMDLHNKNDSYVVMYYHILHMRFPNLIAAFDENKLDAFRKLYKHKIDI